MAFVLDNSVLIGWFVSTQSTAYTKRVAKRAQRERVFVPALWEIEFANVMLVLQRRRVLSQHETAAILGRSARLPFTIDREPTPALALFSLGQQYEMSAYDSAYLELAQRLKLPLATQDVRLKDAAKAAGLLVQ